MKYILDGGGDAYEKYSYLCGIFHAFFLSIFFSSYNTAARFNIIMHNFDSISVCLCTVKIQSEYLLVVLFYMENIAIIYTSHIYRMFSTLLSVNSSRMIIFAWLFDIDKTHRVYRRLLCFLMHSNSVECFSLIEVLGHPPFYWFRVCCA